MPTENALALVVRGTDWSETSRIATLWTREFGKVRALAKGGRRLRSNFEIAFDLLTFCRVVLIRKSHGGLDLLTEAQVVERYSSLRSDLQALYLGYYIAELLADGTQDYDPHPLLFDSALALLRELQAAHIPTLAREADQGNIHNSEFTGDPATRRNAMAARASRFELVWLRELGYAPRLDACAVCDRDMFAEARRQSDQDSDSSTWLVYSQEAGGVLCQECAGAIRDRRMLSLAGWLSLWRLSTDVDMTAWMSLPAAVRLEVRGLLGHAVSSVLGRRPRLLGYLDSG